jgi:hypothetical protein
MDVLIYDGGLVRKLSGELEFPTSLLREAESVLLDKTGYKISLAVKKMSHTFEFEDRDQLLPSSLLINDEYAAKTFVKLVGERIRKVDGYIWVQDSEGIWSNSSDKLKELISEHSSSLIFKQAGAMGVKIFDYGGNEDKIPKMMKQIPLHVPIGTLPLQLAYSLVETDSEPETYIKMFLELVDIVVNHKPELKEYVLNWFAHTLQKPFENPEVALIVTGEKGYGKDTLFDFFGEFVLGERYFINYLDNEQFFDHYDVGRINKIMAKLEEADPTICLKPNNASKLKTTITAKTQNPNPKCKTAFQVKNYCRLVLTTNKGNPVDLSDKERRFVLLASSGERKGDFVYWDSIREQLFTPQGGKHVAEFLRQRDISNCQLRKLPENDYQNFVMESTISVEERFITSWDGQHIKCHALFRLYRAFCKEHDYPGTDNFKQWVQWLIPLKRKNAFDVVVKGHNKEVYYFKPGVEETAEFLEED